MRKFTSFLLILFCAVTTWGQITPEAGKTYRIKHVNSDLYLTTADFTKTSGEGAFRIEEQRDDVAQFYTLIASETEGQFYLKQTKGNVDYYVNAASWNFYANTTEKTSFTIEPGEGEIYTLYQNKALAGNAGVDATAAGSFVYCNKSGDNAKWSFIEVDAEYIAKLDILSVARFAVNNASDTRVGAYKTTAVSGLATAISNYDANMSEENLNTVVETFATLTNNDKVTLGEHELFTLKCVDTNRGYMVYSNVEGKGSETQVYLAGTNRTEYHAAADAEGVYKEWAFVTFNGKKYIYNAEKKQFITADNVVKFSAAATAAINFVAIEDNLYEIQFEQDNKYLSYSPGWGADCVRRESGIDNGCKFYIDKTGTASNETIIAVESNYVNAWKDLTLSTIGYVCGYPYSSENAINNITTISGIQNFEATTSKVALTEGYYYVKNTATNKYATYSDNGFVAKDAATPGIAHIVKFEKSGELRIPNLNKVVKLADAPAVSSLHDDNGDVFVIEDKGSAKCLVKGNGQVMRTENNGEINYWWGDVSTTWYIIPVTELAITINEFASICLPFAVETTEGVTAYSIEETNSTHAVFSDKSDIPANQGAILAGKGTYNLKIKGEATSDWSKNMLKGSTVNEIVTPAGTAYVLAKPEGKEIGLYKAELDENEGTAFLNNANKAYLVVPAASQAVQYFSFNFGGGTTGIEGVEAEGAVSGKIYDITGREVKAITTPGIYIVGGKKVVVK